ncbi:MAG: glycosyltransferase family 4 protein [Thermoleophilia bacterium]
MANFGIDAHTVGARLTGNETYVTNLIDGLLDSGTDHRFTIFFTHPEAAKRWQHQHDNVKMISVHPAQPLIRIPLIMPWLAWRNNIDCLHVQYVGPPLMTVPLVATVHDISYEYFPEFFSKKEIVRFKATVPFTARKARRVLTISNYSKQTLMEAYGIPEEKIVVTYLGVNSRYRPLENVLAKQGAVSQYGINGHYILSVGNLQPRKNMVRLIKAYTLLRNSQPQIDHKLVIVGKKAWKHDPILSFIRQSRWVDEIILTDYVSDQDLPAIYACADLFVYPSIYEGFGLPPLEAMACGTPVIVSDRTSLPEVVGNAGKMVNPYDVNELATAMAAILLEPAAASWFKNAGLKRARQFTWSKCATETLKVYEDVCSKASF